MKDHVNTSRKFPPNHKSKQGFFTEDQQLLMDSSLPTLFHRYYTRERQMPIQFGTSDVTTHFCSRSKWSNMKQSALFMNTTQYPSGELIVSTSLLTIDLCAQILSYSILMSTTSDISILCLINYDTAEWRFYSYFSTIK